MRYIDAGYAAALGTLFLYWVSLVVRRRRLGRLAARVTEQSTEEADDGTRAPSNRRARPARRRLGQSTGAGQR